MAAPSGILDQDLRARGVKRRPVTIPLTSEPPDRLPPWVFGLRPQANLKAGGRRWQEVVALLILPAPENTSRAWTWEARVRRDGTKGRLLLDRLYCLEEDRGEFLEWLIDNESFDLPTKKTITSWIEEHTVLCSHADLPWQRGQRDLLEFFGSA